MDILNYFLTKIKEKLEEYINDKLEEIRFRVRQPIILKYENKEIIIKYLVTTEEILQIMQMICDNSIYSYQNQICNGYITIKGGHRIGITGNCVIEDNKVSNINYVSSLNFRIAKQIKGSSNKLLKYVLDLGNNNIYTTLIVSPPGVRKNNNFKRFNKKH